MRFFLLRAVDFGFFGRGVVLQGNDEVNVPSGV